jgi:hypothetical protein
MSTAIAELENEVIEVADTGALEALNRSEHDIKVTTAKKYPRSMRAFKNSALEMATLDENIAASCFYVLPRGGGKIEGPSVRLAEILGSAYGNVSFGSRIVACDSSWITAQGVCYDYEKNVSACIEVRRRITDKNGNKFKDDMIQVTGRAACSIALREAIFKVIPRALWNDVYEQSRTTSVGKGKTMQQMRVDCMAAWKKAGADEKQLLDFFGLKGIEDVTMEHLIELRGMWTAMKDEGIGVDRILSKEDTVQTGGKKLQKSAPIGVGEASSPQDA